MELSLEMVRNVKKPLGLCVLGISQEIVNIVVNSKGIAFNAVSCLLVEQ